LKIEKTKNHSGAIPGAPAERGQWVPLHPLRFFNKQKMKKCIVLYYNIFNFVLTFFSNLVINDLNALPEVRNCITKIKDTITFFNESAVRMNVMNSSNCKLTKPCETRFLEKHKNVRKFNEKFIVIVEGLEEMSTSKHFNSKTKQRSLEILKAITTPNFVILLSIIAKYSAKFEFISTILQGVNIDLQESHKTHSRAFKNCKK